MKKGVFLGRGRTAVALKNFEETNLKKRVFQGWGNAAHVCMRI
jgi:hypothetical protein